MFAQNLMLVGGGGPGLPPENGADLIGTMSSNTLGPITTSALGTRTVVWPAWEAFDKNIATSSRWSHVIPTWLKVDFGGLQVVYSYMLQGGNNLGDPDSWTFEGSNNDSDWTVLDTRSGYGRSSSEQSFSLSEGAKYRYYRWQFTATNGHADVIINEANIRS